MLNAETTYKDSFKQPVIVLAKCKPIITPELKFIQPPPYYSQEVTSLTPYQVNRGVHIPFNLFWKPKPIVGQTPNYTLFKCELQKPPRIKVMMTSVLPPTTLLEQADDADGTYQTVIENMYLSTKRKSDTDIEKLCQSRDVPDTCVYKANPLAIALKAEIYDQLPGKHIEAGKQWDDKNSRWLSDRNKFYWDTEKQNKKSKVSLITPEKKKEIKELIAKKRLRSPHTNYMYSYGGFKPYAALGVPLQKADFPIDHPLTSTTSAVYTYKKV